MSLAPPCAGGGLLQRQVLEIESHEEGWLAKIIEDGSRVVKVGQPIAIICEEKEQVRGMRLSGLLTIASHGS